MVTDINHELKRVTLSWTSVGAEVDMGIGMFYLSTAFKGLMNHEMDLINLKYKSVNVLIICEEFK